MQAWQWYVNRLRSMTAAELVWRVRGAARDYSDRVRVASGTIPRLPSWAARDAAPPHHLVDPAPPSVRLPADVQARLVARAGRIAKGQLDFFHLRDVALGDPIDWNRDHEHGRATPLTFAQGIDYRDFRVTGDAKVVWEPTRHHQFVVLGWAWRATGDRRFARALAEQLAGWMAQCPYGHGMSWRSPLELAIRMINWTWALDLVSDADVISAALRERIVHTVYLHLWDITRKYSRASSANNHLIGEAAGVFVAASYFAGQFPEADAWRDDSRQILEREVVAQTFADGCNREHAFGYHMFVLQFFLHAAYAGRRAGVAFSSTYRETVRRMCDFAGELSAAGPPPMYGDADDGYVLDWGSGPPSVDEVLEFAEHVLQQPLLRPWRGPRSAGSHLLHQEEREQRPVGPLQPRAFESSGYYLLQWSGAVGQADALSVFVDCAELGFAAIAAHGHADALSVAVRRNGHDVLIDPGTYDYFTYPEWREYFRSTRAHNTVVVDGVDQSVMTGPFLWGARARTRVLSWQASPSGGRLVAEHDGYTRLADPVVHRRAVSLDGPARTLEIVDTFETRGAHDLTFCFHLAEHCRLVSRAGSELAFDSDAGPFTLTVDPDLDVQVHAAGDHAGWGWISRGYHQRAPSTTVVARATAHGPVERRSTLRF